MAVIIDMDMPKNCYDCEFGGCNVCFITGNTIEDYLKREPHCPLKSVDEMMEEIQDYRIMENQIGYMLSIINKYCKGE